MQFRKPKSSSSMLLQDNIKNDKHSTRTTNEKMINSYNIKVMLGELKCMGSCHI